MLKNRRVPTICYDGDSARVGHSILRAKGIEAESVHGGFVVLANVQPPNTGSAQQSSHIVSVEAKDN
ncbi:hypothetical protein EsDP_00006668 [Epichloe bromicola]|uniref:Uncharacterized protein n=1 Tax=Epichloe bromicola TaxID=79588 RepID=A0ABQ0CYA8_9HYPO